MNNFLTKLTCVQTKLTGFLLRYGIPSTALTIAILQFFATCVTPLSRWKGGGYGMYSDYHEVHNDIIVTDCFGQPQPSFSVDGNLIRKAKIWPTKSTLDALGRASRKSESTGYWTQVWVLNFNAKTRQLSRRLRRESRNCDTLKD